MKPTKTTRVALYLRVSTEDKQHPENQRRALMDYAAGQHWQVVETYIDRATGTNSNRPEFQRMLADASRRDFDLLLFWSLDRFSREGTRRTMEHLERLTQHGIKYRSFQEPLIDTTGPYGELLTGILAAFARLEADRIRERIHAGLARARAQGKRPGPRPLVLNMQKLDEEARAGWSLREMARRYNTSAATIHRRLETWRAAKLQLQQPCSKSNTAAPIENSGTTTTRATPSRKPSTKPAG